MKPNLLVRTLTLAVFILLMSGFVAYQAGAFDCYGSDHAFNSDTPGKDSAKPAPRMAPSSKVLILVEPTQETKDTSKKPQQQQQQTDQRDQAPNQSNNAPKAAQSGQDNAPKKNVYMGSSNSGPVFTPAPDTGQPR